MYARYFSRIYIAGVRTKLLVCIFLIFGCVLGKHKESKRSGKEWQGVERNAKESKKEWNGVEKEQRSGKRTERSGKDMCISIETLSRRIHLPRLATPRKVKVCLDGFRLIAFCVFQFKKYQHTLMKSYNTQILSTPFVLS